MDQTSNSNVVNETMACDSRSRPIPALRMARASSEIIAPSRSIRASRMTRSNSEIITPSHGRSRSILALSGARSNRHVTKIQLENLNIVEETDDITYLDGWREVDGDPQLLGLVHGPFYSWIAEDKTSFDEDVMASVRRVLDAVIKHGPFDGIYGFSQGALIASLVAGITTDATLMTAVKSSSSIFGPGYDSLDLGQEPLFKFALLACGAGYSAMKQSCKSVRGAATEAVDEVGQELIGVNSIHIIGIQDKVKVESEGLASLYINPKILYHPGGHGISREIKNHDEMIRQIGMFVHSQGSTVQTAHHAYKFIDTCDVSSIEIHPELQICNVHLKDHLLPGGSKHKATILDCLGAQDPSKPFLKNARDADGSNFTSYGELKEFIRCGNGDLRRIGVRSGDVVAYVAPPVSLFCSNILL